MENLQIRRFNNEDAIIVSSIIGRNLLEINIKDYPKDEMEDLAKIYNPERIKENASTSHMYVACVKDEVVGCGSIARVSQNKDESILLTIFIQPELQGKGVGRKIVKVLEEDEYFLSAKRVKVHASITAHEFYKNLGYSYEGGSMKLNEGGYYCVEKINV